MIDVSDANMDALMVKLEGMLYKKKHGEAYVEEMKRIVDVYGKCRPVLSYVSDHSFGAGTVLS